MTLSQYFSLINVQALMSLKSDASKYFLGYVWWVLEPLLYVAVFYLVFDLLLGSNRTDFLVFLMCGKIPFLWLSKSVVQASNSIVANAGLIGRIDISKSIFPLVVIQEGLYKQAAAFLLLIVVLVIYDYSVSWNWLWMLPIILVNYLLIVACSFIGAMLVCGIRDFAMLISLGMIFLMFSSGIFWDVRNLSDSRLTELVLIYNPVAFLLDAYRLVLMGNVAPDISHLALLGLGCVLLVGITLRIMNRSSQWLALRALSG